MGEILLIAPDWQLRALVRAQLLEGGYVVRAMPSLEIALAYLGRSREAPHAVILDMQRAEVDAGLLADLGWLSGEAPLVLCGGMLDRAALAHGELPSTARVLWRPFCVGDVVKAVQEAVVCPKDKSKTE